MPSLSFDEIKNKLRTFLCCENTNIDQYDGVPPMSAGLTLDQQVEFPEQNHIFGTSIPPPPIDVSDTWDTNSTRTPFENYYYDTNETQQEAEEENEEEEETWGEPSSLPELTHNGTELPYEILETDNESINEKDLEVDSPHPYWDYDEYSLNKPIKLMKEDVWEGVEQLGEDDQWKRNLFSDDYFGATIGTRAS
jgi:hypothetical protein